LWGSYYLANFDVDILTSSINKQERRPNRFSVPGLNIIISKTDSGVPKHVIEAALQRCLYTPDYKTETYPLFSNFSVSIVTYEGYRVRHFSDSRYDFFFEGRMYNLTEEQEEQRIRDIATTIDENQIKEEKLKSLLHKVDAEFFLCIVDRISRKWLLVGDMLSRLPVYACRDENWTMYLRDLTLKQSFIPNEPDCQGVAETLYFGYPLSDRTIFHHSTRLKPVFYILESAHIQTSGTWKQINFEEYHDQTNPGIVAAEAGALFLDACKTRLQPYQDQVLSLSGGLDSRVIGSALNTLQLPFRIVSYLDPWNQAKGDVEVAKKLATIWGKEVEVVHTKGTTEELSKLIISMKAGMNSIAMSFILDFFIRINHPGMVYITGDGGDKLLPDITWDMQGKTISQVASFILKKHTIGAPGLASIAGRIGSEKMHDSLVKLLEGYPEKTLKGKYTRFIFMERGVKWLFEGEDRNRYFFPSVTPFYSIPLVEYLMGTDPAVKRNFQLYRSFISVVSPETLGIENANWNFPINQTGKLKYLLFKQYVKFALPGWANRFIEQKDHQEFDFVLGTLSRIFPGRFNLDNPQFGMKLTR
jgi:asparagine synthase (glutamine-hydrolysing)